MKNTYRIVGAILLLVIYCFAIGHFAKSIIDYDIQSEKTTEKEKYFSSTLINHSLNYSLSDSLKTVSSVNELTTSSVVTLKSLIYEFWTTNKATEQLLETAFSQYSSLVLNFLIQHRKKDIIFPFHYFW